MRIKLNIELIYVLLILVVSCGDEKQFEYKYYPDGSIKEEIEVQNNEATGLYKTYYENGTVKSISYQKRGKLDSTSFTYFKDESLQSEQFYKNGFRNGFCKFYYDNGNVAYVGEYRNGLEVGRHLEYYESDSGQIWNEFEYLIVNGKSEQVKGTKYSKVGEVIEESNWVKIDKTSANDILKLKITIVNPIYDSLTVTVGDFDSEFNLKDSSSLKTYWGNGPSLELDIKPDKLNYVRGYVNDYKVTEKETNGSFKTLSSFIYFEYKL